MSNGSNSNMVNPVFEPKTGGGTTDFDAAGATIASSVSEEGQYFPEASSDEGLAEEESVASVENEMLQQLDEQTRQSRYRSAAQSQEGGGVAAMAAVGAVGSGSVVLPDATCSRDDPWLRPPPERPSTLHPLPEYPSHDDLVGIELQERERMEQLHQEAELQQGRQPSQPSLIPTQWSKQGAEQQASPFALETQQQQQQQQQQQPSAGGGARAPTDAVVVDVHQAPSGASGRDGAKGERDKEKDAHNNMVKDQHAQLLANLPEEEQLTLEFYNICSYAVLGSMDAQAKFNLFLGKLDPFDWNYKYLNPVTLAKAARTKGASVSQAMGSPFRRKSQESLPIDTASASAGTPGVANADADQVAAAKKGVAASVSQSWLPVALRRRRSAQEIGGPQGGAGGGDVEEGKGKGAEPSAPSAKKTSKHKNDKAKKQILFDISGRVLPGQVLALMGPSGSGKTSLLAVLGGRTPPRIKLEGQILVNGEKFDKASRKRIGFVLQDDVLYETLTVYETLMYAGMLRLPRTMTNDEKSARVEAVLKVLGLTRSRDTIIGGFFRRGVSGGERKRVSVGHELLINPAVLLLDEPTSGLDSTTALHLVNLLRDLASAGRAILTTIHQPSSRLYRQLDQVMLLSEGHPMYYGDALRAANWFEHLGFGMPYGTNLADHILDCAMGEVAYNPEAPGAVAASQTEGPVCGAPYIKGGVAVRCLYSTFEAWYDQHPGGFSLGHTDHRKGHEALNEHEEKVQKAGLARDKDQIHKLLDGVRLLLPPTGSFTGLRRSQQLLRPADTPPVPSASLALQSSKQGSEGIAGGGGQASDLPNVSNQPLRSRRASIAAKQSEDASSRQCLLSGRPKSVDIEWGGGAARGSGRASKDMGGGISRLPLVGRLLGAHESIEAADEQEKRDKDGEGGSSSSSRGGPQELLRVMQTPAPGQQEEEQHAGGLSSSSGYWSSKGLLKGGKAPASKPSAALSLEVSPHLEQKATQGESNVFGKTLSTVGLGRKEKGPPDVGALWHTQLFILWARALKVRRFESFSGQQLFQLLAVSIITGLLWWQRGRSGDISAGQNILGLLFFELLFPSFRSLFSALFTFPNEFRILSKERPSGMYKLSAYYWARVGADLPIELALPTIFVVIVYWFGGLRATAGAFFANWASLMLVITLAQSWGLLIGGVFMDPKQAQTVTTVIMLTFLLVGGFYVKDVPVWIGWIKYFSFVYWGNNLLIKIEFGHLSLRDKSLPGDPEVSNLQAALDLQIDPNRRIWEEPVILISMLIILRWATYMTLRWKTSTSQKSL